LASWLEVSPRPALNRSSLLLAVQFVGERFDRARHQLITEIKAVTYHRLAVEHERGNWQATVVFDI